MEIKIKNIVCTNILTFVDKKEFDNMIKAIDISFQDYNSFITYHSKNTILKFSSDYLRNSLIEIK